VFADDLLGTSLDQRVTRFHQIQSISVDNSSLSKTSSLPTAVSCRASVLFLLLHGGSVSLQAVMIASVRAAEVEMMSVVWYRWYRDGVGNSIEENVASSP